MRLSITKILFRTLSHYRKAVSYQFIFVVILSAVITGSLLTGFSVRNSIRSSAEERLGNTGILVSSGLRYFDPAVARKLAEKTGTDCMPVLVTDGLSRNFTSGRTYFRTQIYGVHGNLFSFLGGGEYPDLPGGEAIINSTLARYLEITEGEDIIVNINLPGDIPANAPFAPGSDDNGQRVFRIAAILPDGMPGDFTPLINQVVPGNIFIRASDLDSEAKANRLLVKHTPGLTSDNAEVLLGAVLTPEDIGLRIRRSNITGEPEIISSRVFIDREISRIITSAIPSSRPVITYLANGIRKGASETPYSFVAAIDQHAYPEVGYEKGIVINTWLAEDLSANINDTLEMRWYAPGRIQELEEESVKLTVSAIKEYDDIWGDSLLMPEFPGIAGKESCSRWDAGVEIDMKKIRDRDEEYWNLRRGTPKAFISYTRGNDLWGSNFGPATAIRFPASMATDSIKAALVNRLKPSECGFMISDLRRDMMTAADESVDFSTLFLSLGFFIIVSCIILLMLSVSSFFNARKDQVFVLHALGFSRKWIGSLLFYETSLTAVSGALAGVFAGLLVNSVIVSSLNSVWIGAVQSGTLKAYTGIAPMIIGFTTTIIITFTFLALRIRSFLRELSTIETGEKKLPSVKIYNLLMLPLIAGGAVLAIIAFLSAHPSPSSSFSAGVIIFAGLILFWRMILADRVKVSTARQSRYDIVSRSYYRFHPYSVIMPVLLIAAGLFAVIITGVNRLQITGQSIAPSGGTGGYAIWGETIIPVEHNLNSPYARKTYGLDEFPVSELSFVQARRAAGNDASCLNLNHITSPPVLGIDPASFSEKGAFSFATLSGRAIHDDPWEIISRKPENNTIYGFADKTVLDWGLKRKTGDTLRFKSETGQLFNIVIAGGLKSSVFQGNLIIGEQNFLDLFPSVSGYSVFLATCEEDSIGYVSDLLRTRLEPFGAEVIPARERLAAFFRVTNTYLSVFTILGSFGMILGVLGLGFVLRNNYSRRKREFALMVATGFRIKDIRLLVLEEQLYILTAGVITGLISALISVLPSSVGQTGLPWGSVVLIILSVMAAGTIAIIVSTRGLSQGSLISSLRRE